MPVLSKMRVYALLFVGLALGTCSGAAAPEGHSTRRLTWARPSVVTSVLGVRPDGTRKVEGVITGFGVVTDPGCHNEPHICFEQRECIYNPGRLRRVLLGAGVDATPSVFVATQARAECGDACPMDGSVMGFPVPTANVQQRGQDLQAGVGQGGTFKFVLTQMAEGTEAEAKAGFQRIVDAFLAGKLDICKGYSFVPQPFEERSTAGANTSSERYDIEIGIAVPSERSSCTQWERGWAKPAFKRCAASLAGQPSPAVDAACSLEVGPDGKTSQLITITIRSAVGSYEEVKSTMDTLVGDIDDGSYGAMCLWAEGLKGYKRLHVQYSRMFYAQAPSH